MALLGLMVVGCDFPQDGEVATEQVEELTARLREIDWRMHNVTVSPVSTLDDVPEGLLVSDSTL